MNPRFSKAAFDSASALERKRLCAELAEILQGRLQIDMFHETIALMISDLRELGHDLWSYDEDDDLSVWGPDYVKKTGPGIIVSFRGDAVTVEWPTLG